MKVLVVDDSATSRMVLNRAVTALGHECVLAEDGEAGWSAYRREEPVAIISDLVMPGIDGLELCRRIREDTGAPYTCFVLLTALDDPETALSGMRAGADDYLTKPFKVREIEMKLIAADRVSAVHKTLGARTRELEDEVRMAAAVRRGMSPAAPPDIRGVTVGGLSVPGVVVGGGYHDFIVSPSGEVVLALGDVAAGGISATFLMALTRTVLREHVARGLGPHAALEATNATVCSDLGNAGVVVDLFCASYSPATGSLTFASAGPKAALLRRADGAVERLDAEGAPVGARERAGCEPGRTQLAAGDLVLLFSDGVVEAGAENGTPFGEQRLGDVVAGSRQGSPTDVGRAIHAAVVGHAGEASAGRQDVRLVGLRVSAAAAGAQR